MLCSPLASSVPSLRSCSSEKLFFRVEWRHWKIYNFSFRRKLCRDPVWILVWDSLKEQRNFGGKIHSLKRTKDFWWEIGFPAIPGTVLLGWSNLTLIQGKYKTLDWLLLSTGIPLDSWSFLVIDLPESQSWGPDGPPGATREGARCAESSRTSSLSILSKYIFRPHSGLTWASTDQHIFISLPLRHF